MGFDSYHEPPDELSQETRTFARMIQSLIEETEAIDWYEQALGGDREVSDTPETGVRHPGRSPKRGSLRRQQVSIV